MALFFYETGLGIIGIEEVEGSISRVFFNKESVPQDIYIYESDLLKEAALQLKRYISGEIKSFSLPLRPIGTPFMKEVWNLLCEIPYGETLTYKDMAEKLGKPNASRAIGLACARNPIPIFIPCHRVLGISGKLTGYIGGIEVKKNLLAIEKNCRGLE